MGWLDETPNKEARVLLLVALRDITDGKIFVEAERAKLTRMLAKVPILPIKSIQGHVCRPTQRLACYAHASFSCHHPQVTAARR